MILGRGVRLVAVGVLIGVALAIGLTRLIAHMLFGIAPTDLTTIVGVSAFVALVAVVSCLLPAWRAARVLPSVALRAG
jgi:putative ABC transport system permease protein